MTHDATGHNGPEVPAAPPTGWDPDLAAAPAPPPAAAPVPVAAMAPPPMPAPAPYAQYPPPAYPAPVPPPDPAVRRFRTRTILWGVAAVIAAPIITVLGISTVMGQLYKGADFSPDYTGAPVEASDASATTIVSPDATMAYEIGADWVDGSAFIDVEAVSAGFMEGQALLGTHLTADPYLAQPQLVMVMGGAPEGDLRGTLEDVMIGYLDGARDSGVSFDQPPLVPITTANGLEGYQVEFEAAAAGETASMSAVAVGHGTRLVIVQFTAFAEPVDAVARQQLVDSLRIDK